MPTLILGIYKGVPTVIYWIYMGLPTLIFGFIWGGYIHFLDL